VTLKVGRTVILPLALNGCETWSCTLREGHMLGVFENKLLRKIFGPKKEKITQGWEDFMMRSSVIRTPCYIIFG